MDTILRLEYDGDTFDLHGLKALEMDQVNTWTGLATRKDFYAAIRAENPKALIAAFMLSRLRKGEKPRWGEVDVDLDELLAYHVDPEGRKVEPILEVDENGEPLLVKFDGGEAVKDDDGNYVPDPRGGPVAVLDAKGYARWRYVDTGEPVPPTDAAEETPSPATSPQPGSTSASDSGIPLTAVS